MSTLVSKDRANNQAEATATIEAERFGPALKKIDEAVQEAKENVTEYGRPSAWR
jgi:thioredoxin-like negative regulator of GroEL